MNMPTDRHTDRVKNIRTLMLADTHSQPDRQTDRQTDSQSD